MNPVRVFLVDDTATVRHILTGILEEEPGIQVVGTAGDGEQALRRLRHLDVDVLILDVEMPGMSGLDVLRTLRTDRPDLPVLIFSSLTEKGAAVTVDALTLGAAGYVTKPSMTGSAESARNCIRSNLVPRIQALMHPRTPHTRDASPPPAPPREPARARGTSARPGRVDAVVVGVSMGGPQALTALFAGLPADLPVPLLIVQHMPPLFISALAHRLSGEGRLPVTECNHAERLGAGRAWIAPGGYHLQLARYGDGIQVQPSLGEPVNFCRPSVDVLFRDAAAVFGGHVLAVVMTGMGHDGLAGARAIHDAGGEVLVQCRESSVVWGMGGSVVAAELADAEVPLNGLADEIARRVGRERDWWEAGTATPAAIHPEHRQ